MNTRPHVYCFVGSRSRTLHIIDPHFTDRTVCGQAGELRLAHVALLLPRTKAHLCKNCERMRDATSL